MFKKEQLRLLLHPQKLLLKNLGLKQTILKNTFWLAIAEGVSKFLKFFLFIYIARILGATEYGKFGFASAFVGLFLVFADLGIFKILTREFARSPEKEKDFSALLSLKILLSVCTFILIFACSFFITETFLIRKIIWILGIEVLLNSFSLLFYAFFRARQKMEYQSWGQILQVILVTSIGFFVLFNLPSAKNLSLGYLLGTLFALVFILIFFHFKFSPLKFSFKKSIWKNYLVMSYPLGLAVLVGSFYSNIDSAMMGYFNQITQTGWYNAAQKIATLMLIPAGLIAMSFFPALSKFYRASKERFQRIWDYHAQSVIFLSVPFVVGGIALAEKIIDFVYDPSYFPAILGLQILLAAFGVAILTGPFIHTLVIANQQKKVFWVSLFGAITNLTLNLILIPRYSLYGAAFATLATYLLFLFLTFKLALKHTEIKPFNLRLLFCLIAALFATFLMYLMISQPKIYNLHILWIILVGSLTYSIGFFICKKIGRYVILKRRKA